MAQPVKNTCLPSNIYGGFSQTLFLGCSVMSFSVSQGFNEQVTDLTVQLVQDTCSGAERTYYDTDLSPQTTTDADPGFYGLTYNLIGAPVYFRVADWEFCGLVQSWEESNSDSGNPTYSVKVVDPRQILEGAQLIINEYSGSVANVYNLINTFGYAESTGAVNCPEYYQSAPGVYSPGNGSVDGTVFGSPATKFGGADVNHNGMQWNQILASARILLCSYPAVNNQFSPYGRLVFRAPGTYPAAGMGIIPANVGNLGYYYIDLNEVPNAPTYWRLNGTSVGLMEAISQICQDSGHDYYVELIPVVDALIGPGVHKFIKIRTVNRVAAPALNSIDTFVANAGREVISYNKGRELRNEPTSSFVIGGPKQSFYQAVQSTDPEGDGDPTPKEADDMIIPYFGLDSNGNSIVPVQDTDGWWEFDAPSLDLALQLGNVKYGRAVASTLLVNERELIAAAGGFDLWMAHASIKNTELWQALNVSLKSILDVRHIIKILVDIGASDELRPADILALRDAIFKPHDDSSFDFEVIQIGFAWIEKLVKEYYGQKYQVRIPFTCGRTDSESDIIQMSEEPSDGGWTEVTPVLGLSHPSLYTDFFILDDNRLGAFCKFNTGNLLELSGLGVNDFVTDSTSVWMKIGVEQKFVYLDVATLFSPRVVITLPQKVVGQELMPNIGAAWAGVFLIVAVLGDLIPEATAKAALDKIQKVVGTMSLHWPGTNRAIMPDAAGFGIKSNVLKYGPWGSVGPAGMVSVVNDEGLVPWEYGGFTTLNLAGNAIANAGLTNTQVTEEGSVTVAGYPELPIGAELLAADAGGPFSGGGNNLLENRTVSSGSALGGTYYYAPIYAWDGTYGPNVTSLTVQVGPGGLTTQYNMRTWTPKFGVFSKGNADRIKQIGMQRLSGQKQMRAWALQRFNLDKAAFLNKLAGDRPGIKVEEGAFGKVKSPHEVLVGQLLSWNNETYKRSAISTSSTIELPVELAEEYGSKAFMSLDGLLSPVSITGSGGLSPFAVPGSGCQTTSSRGAQPPIDKQGEAGSFLQYNINHSQDYLNPFANPGDPLTTLSDTTGIGHDIELVARGSTPPASSMIMPIQGYANTNDFADSDYAADYRVLALKGPLLIQQPGYDLDGFPIPNKVDTPANARLGIFAETGLKAKFMDNWLRQRDTWPVAPLDLRFDRARGVWTIPQYRNIVAELQTSIPPSGTGLGIQISGPELYDTGGSVINNPEMILYDVVGNLCLSSGDRVIAEYDPYECIYRIIEASNTGSIIGDECISVSIQETGGCTRMVVGLKEKYGDGTAVYEQEFITGIAPYCCPTGGLGGISYTTSKFQFNNCGQLIDIVVGSGGSITCDCTGTGGNPPGGDGNCCPDRTLPDTLNIEVVVACGTYTGTLEWDGNSTWVGTIVLDCGGGCTAETVCFQFSCAAGTYTLFTHGNTATDPNPTCIPFSAEFSGGIGTQDACGHTITFCNILYTATVYE